MHDITERKRGEDYHAFLLKLSDALRPLADPDKVQAVAADLLGAHLRVNHCHYGEVRGAYVCISHSYAAMVRGQGASSSSGCRSPSQMCT